MKKSAVLRGYAEEWPRWLESGFIDVIM